MNKNYAFNEEKMLASITEFQRERSAERLRLVELRQSRMEDAARIQKEDLASAEREAVAASLYEELDHLKAQESTVMQELDAIWPARKPPNSVKMASVLSLVCEEFGISRVELTNGRRTHNLCMARYAAMKILRDAGYSFPRIGAVLKLHHTTVIHGVERAEYFIGTRPPYAMSVDRVRAFAGSAPPERMCA